MRFFIGRAYCFFFVFVWRFDDEKSAKVLENDSKMEPKSVPGALFRFWLNLVFVQRYRGFACFIRFRRALGPPKIEKKMMPTNDAEKNCFFGEKVTILGPIWCLGVTG